MELQRFREEFAAARAGHELLTFTCHCAVTYSGRAEAYLPRGDRLIIMKQDGVLLVHQPVNGNPINYLKAGAQLALEHQENHLVLRGKFTKEFIEIELFRVYNCLRQRMEDGQKQTLSGSEADMSDMLRDQPALVAPDFKPIAREEQTDVGFIDVFGHDGNGNLVVVECKRYTAGLAAVTQLHRYVKRVMEVKGTQHVKGVMAAPKVTGNALELLKKYGYAWAEVQPPKRHERHDKGQATLETY